MQEEASWMGKGKGQTESLPSAALPLPTPLIHTGTPSLIYSDCN